jgi:hypothetical protein
MSKRTASTYSPDQTIEGVSPQDIQDNCLESRHFANNEIDTTKIATLASYVVTGMNVVYDVTTGAAEVKVFDSDAPFKFRVVDVVVEPRGASTNGTMKITNGTNDITNAMVCAVDKTMVRAGTVDNAYSTIAKGGSLSIVCAGDTVADTIGLVTVHIQKID